MINQDENLQHLLNVIETETHNYVLKPQREGGGNKYFGLDIK